MKTLIHILNNNTFQTLNILENNLNSIWDNKF